MSAATPDQTTPEATTPETTTPSVATVPVTTPSSTPADWRESLSPDLRGNPIFERMEDVESLAKEHINVQKLIGVDKVPRPQEDWTPEQFEDFYQKVGRPAEAKDYDLEGIERPEDLPWDDGFQESMVGIMHQAGLTSPQVQAILKGYIDSVGGQYQSAIGEMNQTRESGIQDLRNEWGKSYDSQIDLAMRAFRAGAGEGFEELAGMTLQDGGKLGDHPAIIKAFAALGGKMSEHGLVGGTSIRTAKSPAEAITEKNQLLSDPDFLKAYLDEAHLEHSAAVKRVHDLTVAEIGHTE